MFHRALKSLNNNGQLTRLLSANFSHHYTKPPVHVAVTGAAG